MPKLSVTFRQSGFAGRRLEFEHDVLRLGRDPDTCEILFDEATDRVVSRLHAELRWEDDAPVIAPYGERLVFRNGERVVGRAVLAPGDVLEFAGLGGPAIQVEWDLPSRTVLLPQVEAPLTATDPLSVLRSLDAPIAPALPPEPPPELRTSQLSLTDLSRLAHEMGLASLGDPAPLPAASSIPTPPSEQATAVLQVPQLDRRTDPGVPAFAPAEPLAPEAPTPPSEQRTAVLQVPQLPSADPLRIPTPPSEQRTAVLQVPQLPDPLRIPTPPSEQRTAAIALPRLPDAPLPAAPALAAEAPTDLSVRPVAPVPPATPERATPATELLAPVPPAPAPTPEHATPGTELVAPVPLPEPAATPRTMMLPTFVPNDDAAGSTQFLRIDDLQPPEQGPPSRSKRPIAIVAIAGALVLALAGGGYLWWQGQERVRIADARIERIRQTLAELEAAGRQGDAEYARLQEELAREIADAKAPPAESKPKPATAPNARPTPQTPTPDPPAATGARDAAEQTQKTETLKQEARSTFAAVRTKELEMLGVPRARRAPLAAQRTELWRSYEQARSALSPAGDPLVRRTALWLGECDATIPAAFSKDVADALAKLKAPGTDRDRFVEAIQRGIDAGYGRTITAALADQGLPVELYFLAWSVSNLDPKYVGVADQRGLPKGLWPLLPGPAERLGLRLGAQVASTDVDPADERFLYEKSSKGVAKFLREQYRGPAAGSALLLAAAWDAGDTAALASMKRKAGLSPDDADPARTSLWTLIEAGAVPEVRRKAAARFFAAVLVAAESRTFGLPFDPPIRHVDVLEVK